MPPSEPGSEQRQQPALEEGLFRIVAESATDAIITINGDSIILFANPAAQRLFGYDHEELLGAKLTMLMPEYLRHLHEAAVERYVETGKRHLDWGGIELPGLHRSGREIALELTFGETSENGEQLFTGVIRDISERKRVERRWEAQYETATALASSSELEEAAGKVLEVICRSLDWRVGIMWRPDPLDDRLYPLLNWHEPGIEAEAFLAVSAEEGLATGVGLPGMVRERNEPIWIEEVEQEMSFIRTPAVREAGLHTAFAFPIAGEEEFIGVMEFYSPSIRKPDNGLLNMVRSTSSQIAQFVKRTRAEAEIRRLNSELEERVVERTAQLEKSAGELESFAYSVSHDLRGPLRGIDGFSQLLLEDYGESVDESARSYLLRIRRAAGRMGELIDDLLALSRISQGDLHKQRLDLAEIARGVVNELRQGDPERDVEVVIQPRLKVEGDPKLLRILMDNLLGNAWKFTQPSESPRIELGSTSVDGEEAYFVRDNGAGFDMRYAEKLFNAFHRLHSPNEFEGTGIGLATVSRILQRHGGRIWAEAKVDQGATFYFTL